MSDPNPIEALFETLLSPGGTLECTRRELEDVMAVVFLKSYQRVPLSTPDANAFIADFFARVGVEREEQLEELDRLLGDYFARHPLRRDVLNAVVEALPAREPLHRVRAGYAGSGAF